MIGLDLLGATPFALIVAVLLLGGLISLFGSPD